MPNHRLLHLFVVLGPFFPLFFSLSLRVVVGWSLVAATRRQATMSSLQRYYDLPWLIFFLLHGWRGAAAAGKVPAIIVFGDSSVDTGNNNFIPTIARSNFWPYGRDYANGLPTGRFSNGRLATDFISEAFGLPPSIPAYLDTNCSIDQLATGVSFASAATGLDNATASVLVITSNYT